MSIHHEGKPWSDLGQVFVHNDPPARTFPRDIAAVPSFRGLMLLARDMCGDGRLQAREVGRRRFTFPKPVLRVQMLSPLESITLCKPYETFGFKFELRRYS
jgi:hypothetical protein